MPAEKKSVEILSILMYCAKTAELIEVTGLTLGSVGPKEPCTRCGRNPPREGAIFGVVWPTEKYCESQRSKRIIQSPITARCGLSSKFFDHLSWFTSVSWWTIEGLSVQERHILPTGKTPDCQSLEDKPYKHCQLQS